MLKRFAVGASGAVLCIALGASGAMARNASAQDKPKQGETKIVIKDDTTPKVKKGAQVVSDAALTTAVKSRLMKDKVARGTAIDVETKEGIVTITGAVPTAADKTRIGRLVARTSGVKDVENKLDVSAAPSQKSTVGTSGDTKGDTKIVVKDDTTPKLKKGARVVTDASITTAVKTRLMGDAVARGTSIDVETKDGVVTIAGTVPTVEDRDRIGRLVLQTSGVKKIENKLTVGK